MNHDHRDRKYKSEEFKSTEVISVQFFRDYFIAKKYYPGIETPISHLSARFCAASVEFFNLSKVVTSLIC